MKYQTAVRVVQPLSTQRAVASPAVFHPSRCLTGNWLRRTWLERFPTDFTEKNYSRASAKAEICPWFGLSGGSAALWCCVHTLVKNNLCVCHSFALLVPSCGFPAALFSTSPAPLLPGAHARTVHSLVFGHCGTSQNRPHTHNVIHKCLANFTGWLFTLTSFLFSLMVGGN